MKNWGSTNKQLVAMDIAVLWENSFDKSLTKIEAVENYGVCACDRPGAFAFSLHDSNVVSVYAYEL